MSIARPDSSRCREPKGPGLRFGSSAASKLIRGARLCVALLVLAGAAQAEEDGPIFLTNADVDRLHSQEAKAGTATKAEPVASETAKAGPDDVEAMRALDASLKRRLDTISRQSMGHVSRTLDARALDEAPATMPPISAGPEAAALPPLPAAPAPPADLEAETDEEPQASVDRPVDPTPACVYGPRGHLLHAPKGRSCAPVRVGGQSRHFQSGTAASDGAARRGEPQVGCVYGSRGQLLYASPGVECAS